MSLLYPAFTAAMLVAAGCCLVHARRDRTDLAFLGAALVFGLVMEAAAVAAGTSPAYSYPTADLLSVAAVPVAVSLGWAVVIYAGFQVAREWRLAPLPAAAFTGLYALHFDLAADAVAIRVPYWSWAADGAWFGVPLGNFLGWFLAAAALAGVFGRLRRRTANPLVLAAGSVVGAELVVGTAFTFWGPFHGGVVGRKVAVLALVLGGALAVLGAAELRPRPVPHALTAAALVYHGFFLAVLFAVGLHRTAPVLLAVSLAMLAVGLAVHGWPLLRRGSRDGDAVDGEVVR